MSSDMTPAEFQDYLAEMSLLQFHSVMEDDLVQEYLGKGEAYTQIWEEAIRLNRSLEALEVPKSRVDITALVMASISNEQSQSKEETSGDTFVGRIIELVKWEFQIPAWGLAALLMILLGSIGFNVISGTSTPDMIDQPPLVADAVPVPPEQPQIIHVIPQTPNSYLPVSQGKISTLSANPTPSLVIIMGVPPSAWMTESHDDPPTTYVSLKENNT